MKVHIYAVSAKEIARVIRAAFPNHISKARKGTRLMDVHITSKEYQINQGKSEVFMASSMEHGEGA